MPPCEPALNEDLVRPSYPEAHHAVTNHPPSSPSSVQPMNVRSTSRFSHIHLHAPSSRIAEAWRMAGTSGCLSERRSRG